MCEKAVLSRGCPVAVPDTGEVRAWFAAFHDDWELVQVWLVQSVCKVDFLLNSSLQCFHGGSCVGRCSRG
jgi:hypothetical protein